MKKTMAAADATYQELFNEFNERFLGGRLRLPNSCCSLKRYIINALDGKLITTVEGTHGGDELWYNALPAES